MSYSILPSDWQTIETWIARMFLLLGIVVIGPWVALVVYDLMLYAVRMVFHTQSPNRAAGGIEEHAHDASSESGSDQDDGRGRARIREEEADDQAYSGEIDRHAKERISLTRRRA